MKHTQTKLRVGEKYPCDIYADRAGQAIARTVNPQTEGEDEANARRLAACWNACEGISTENLEANNSVKALAENYNSAKALLEELLEELKNIANATPRNWGAPLNDTASFQAWAQSRARAAIAKAEGAL